MQKPRVLSIDPGETTGIAFFHNGKVLANTFEGWSKVDHYIRKLQPTVIVVENFRLRRHAALSLVGSTFPVCQALGVVKYLAQYHSIPLVVQSPAVMTAMHRVVRPRGSSEHTLDALKHGLAYLEGQGLLGPYERFLED